jgi:UDP-N-acetylglucosamine--N-acetylmuramyl-(pentapeptide) pyrophosphoryl-undecaprenol N-acetylglucosamine transferase
MNKMQLEKIIISSGGTGGHFYPGLSIARQFKDDGGQVLLLLSGTNGIKQCEIAKSFGIDAVALPKMPSPNSIKNLFSFAFGLVAGFIISLIKILSFKPNAIIGMGAFTQAPIVTAAWVLRKKIFLHDGNVKIGKANRIFSKIATFLGAGFPPVNGDKVKCPIENVGMPVRMEIEKFAQITKEEAIAKLNDKFNLDFEPEKPVVLITGGSQGAQIFNEVIPLALANLQMLDLQVLHLAGKGKTQSALDIYKNVPFKYCVLEETNNMELFYGAADFAICRSGGGTLSELAVFKVASLLIPYPYAAELHQDANADYFVANNAAIKLDNNKLDANKVYSVLQEIFEDDQKLNQMRSNAAALAKLKAAKNFLNAIAQKL